MPDDLQFAIEEWSPSENYVRDIARTSNAVIAQGIFDLVLRRVPDDLDQAAQPSARHMRDRPPPKPPPA